MNDKDNSLSAIRRSAALSRWRREGPPLYELPPITQSAKPAHSGPILVLDDELDDEMKRIDAVTKPIIRSMIDHVHRTGVMPALVADGQVIAPARRVYREVYRWNPRLGGWVYKGVRRG